MNSKDRLERMVKAIQQDIDLVDIFTRADSIAECVNHLKEKFEELKEHVKVLPRYEVLKEKDWEAIENINYATKIIDRLIEMAENNLNYIGVQAEIIQGIIAEDTHHPTKPKDAE